MQTDNKIKQIIIHDRNSTDNVDFNYLADYLSKTLTGTPTYFRIQILQMIFDYDKTIKPFLLSDENHQVHLRHFIQDCHDAGIHALGDAIYKIHVYDKHKEDIERVSNELETLFGVVI